MKALLIASLPIVVTFVTGPIVANALPRWTPQPPTAESGDRDRTGTPALQNECRGGQTLEFPALEHAEIIRAEGMGLEPTTGCPAPEFQSGR